MKADTILEWMFAKLTKVPPTMKAKYEMKKRLPFKCANENKRIQRKKRFNGVYYLWSFLPHLKRLEVQAEHLSDVEQIDVVCRRVKHVFTVFVTR